MPLTARVQLYKNYADIYTSLLCRYHETIEVMSLKPKDAALANIYDESQCATAFPIDDYGFTTITVQVGESYFCVNPISC